MNITAAVLINQADRALKAWPFIPAVEKAHGLPAYLLLAVGSRETNLTRETGDGGHGHGVWQLDDRSHTIPAGFDTNVQEQANAAAGMLKSLIAHFGGNVKDACAAYNGGVGGAEAGIREHGDADYFTTGRDYGSDVVERLHVITQHYHPAPPPAPVRRLLSLTTPPMHGTDVKAVQTKLVRLGARLTVDGIYGQATKAAVIVFQRRDHLTTDGVCGPATYKALGL